jgi:predicted RecB family nuclease
MLCLNAVYALLQLVVSGPYTEINILSFVGGAIYTSVLFYFLTSVLIAGVAFGYFSSFITRKSEDTKTTKMFSMLQAKVDNIAQQMKQALSREIARFSLDQLTTSNEMKKINTQLAESQKKIERTVEECEKQNTILDEVKKKIAKIELQLAPKTCLASSLDVKAISGIGQKTAENLKAIGITTVEDLITANTIEIAQETGIPESTVAKMQAAAQLFLIPGLSPKTVKLLQKAEITSMDELACQNPVQLFRKIAAITKKREDRPTIEEIASYIAYARYNSGHVWYNPTVTMVTLPREIAPS